MMLWQKTFFRALAAAFSPESRFHARAGYFARLNYYHARLMRSARGDTESQDWPHLASGDRLELSDLPILFQQMPDGNVILDLPKKLQMLVLIPGYRNVDGVWVDPLLIDVTSEYEPGNSISTSSECYRTMLEASDKDAWKAWFS